MDEILRYLLEAWRRQLEPALAPMWDSAGLWRTLALAFVTVSAIGWRSRDRVRSWLLQPLKRQRDRHVFRQANAILQEPELYALLAQLERGQVVKIEKLTRLSAFLGEAGNRFFSSTVREAVEEFLAMAQGLESYLGNTFGTPDQDELNRLGWAVERSYRAFRNAIREALIM